MELCWAFDTFIVPYWNSVKCWPILCPNSDQFIDAVKEMRFLPKFRKYYQMDRKTSIFGRKDLQF